MRAWTIPTALTYVGGWSQTTKMPGPSYGLPAWECQTGSKLASRVGTVCSKCYARRNMYVFPNVKSANYRRLNTISKPRWAEAMVWLINKRKVRWFRWHDTGDLQSREHFEQIAAIARACPRTRFWLPTKEPRYVGKAPANLVVRISAPLIGSAPKLKPGQHGSSVGGPGFPCPAHDQGNQCRDCRACWDPNVPIIAYREH